MWLVETWVLLVMTTLILASNLLSIVAIVFRGGRKITRMYFFLLHLSLADGLTALLTLSPELLWPLLVQHDPIDQHVVDVLCRGVNFVQMLAPYLSSYVLVMMAWDRHQSICSPIRHRVWKPNESLRKILSAYLIALCLSVPQILVFGAGDQRQCVANVGPTQGWLARLYVGWLCLSNFLLPLFALSFLLLRICHALNQRSRSTPTPTTRLQWVLMPSHCCRCLLVSESVSTVSRLSEEPEQDMRPRSHSVEAISRAKMRSVRHTTVIISSFVSCSLPVVAVQFYVVVFGTEHDGQNFGRACYLWLVALKSILNPWIYMVLNRDLRESLRRLLPCLPRPQSRRVQSNGVLRRRAFTLEADAAGHTTVANKKQHKELRLQLSQPIVVAHQRD